MYYSTYRWVSVIGYVVVMGLLGIFFFFLSFALGIAFLIGFALLGVVGFWVGFRLVEDRLDEYGGRIPMPNLGLGMWGVDIVDEDRAVRPADRGDGRSPYDGNELDSQPLAAHCPYCHAVLAKANARFCNDCGKQLSA